MFIKYADSLFVTVESAAAAWAGNALPDTSVIEPTESPFELATDLESVWWSQEPNAPEDLSHSAPGATVLVDEKIWRDACREALVARIFRSREDVLVARFETADRKLLVITTTGGYGPGRFTGYQIVDITHSSGRGDLVIGKKVAIDGRRLGNPFGTANAAAVVATSTLLPPPAPPPVATPPSRGADYLAGNERALGMGPETGDK